MTELEKLSLSQPLTDVYNAMEQDIMLAIAKQLAKDGSISASSEWRLQRLAEAGDLDQTAIAIIASYTGIQSDLLTEALSGAAYSVIDKLEPGFRELARQGFISDTPVPASKSVDRAIQTFHKQAASDLNLVNTVMRYKAKQAYVDLVNKTYDAVNAVEDVSDRQELLNTLGKHTMSTVMGAESRQEAVRKCIREFNSKGIPAFVDAAGREWSPEAYINMDIRTTVSNTANAAQDARCDDYGIDLIAISSHPGARPKCAPYQGRIFSRSNKSGIAHDGNGKEIPYEPLSSTSYGEPDGLFGINCRHKKYPFIDGVNFQRYFPYDKEENDKRYKEIQEQRRLERKVRNTKREADMLDEVGDTEGAKAARVKLKEQRKAYRTYCDEHELTQRNDRLTVSKGSVSAAKTQKPLDNGGGSGIMKSRETTVVNAKSVVGQWERRSNFDNDIDDIIEYQGFNGNPKIVYNRKDFDNCVEKDHFLAERTFCADTQEQLDLYDNQLKAINGENYFYVNCGVGGAQYGQGMYCAADYTKGTIPYADFEHEIKQYSWSDKHQYSKTNWMTLDPSAKVLNVPDGYDKKQCNEYVYRLYEENYIQNRLSSDHALKKQWEAYQKDMQEVRKLNGSSNPADWDKADILSEKAEAKYPAASEFHSEIVRLGNSYKDTGVMAAEMGYDAINAKGHGTTDSYTVVLNRTKLIIYGGDDYEYRKK